MPSITIKTMKGCSKEAIKKTMKEATGIVSNNLGYDPATDMIRHPVSGH